MARLRACSGVAACGLMRADGSWIGSLGMPARPELKLLTAIGQVVHGPGGRAGKLSVIVPVPALDMATPLWLVLWDNRRWRPRDANMLLARTTELVTHATFARLRQADQRRRSIFDRASATAQIGAWSCSLPDESLIWTNGVYDLFELPRESEVRREQILEMYEPASRTLMQKARADAIANLGEFTIDAEIVTPSGRHKWIRITAAVESQDGRATSIFGMKRDVTIERQLAAQTRELAETDSLTRLANRSLFQQRLDDLCHPDQAARNCALLLLDLDKFKQVNDTLGHASGDACLVETARRLRDVCPRQATIARIGGDEFAIVLQQTDQAALEHLSHQLVQTFARPFVLGGQSIKLGASLGLARRGGEDADTLYRNADSALYAAKSAGRGTWRQFAA
ncbi:MAG: GGDEF domain-containing protein [Devosia sp.]|uniref:diguanylate cyclase domain-containing protein n=1 Tax=Devosia sp. TaxID=1871048 RepID=UPI0024CB0138|nr:diguanylate cyclase [Devosia sp.]UYO00089.1 MAG: GGDEF domain-containing protein [Devosia sp.]